MIKIGTPLGFSEIGKRAVNQDYIYPKANTSTANDKIFIVCDGIGGLDKGEVASQTLTESMVKVFKEGTPLSSISLTKALQDAISKYNTFLENNISYSRMGSTLAMLQLNETFVVVAHIGDSRIYHLRNGKILYQSVDHKKTTELVAAGLISEEQATMHPWRNKLSKAIVSDMDMSRINNLAEIRIIDDLRANDLFFICSDGILERNNNDFLSKLSSDFESMEIINKIRDNCAGVTSDNYSCILIQIKSID